MTHALALLLLAIVFSPSAFTATINEAAKLVQDEKYEEAVRVYDSILSSASSLTTADARYGKGLALKALRKYPEAVACWEGLIKPGLLLCQHIRPACRSDNLRSGREHCIR